MKLSDHCRLRAEEMELMAGLLSLKQDREHYREMARSWRTQEAEALAKESLAPQRVLAGGLLAKDHRTS